MFSMPLVSAFPVRQFHSCCGVAEGKPKHFGDFVVFGVRLKHVAS